VFCRLPSVGSVLSPWLARQLRPGAGTVLATLALTGAGACLAMLALAGCGGTSGHAGTTDAPSATTGRPALPGTGKPLVTIGDKNIPGEQFVLGELYYQALSARGFNVMLNRNIGPPEVTIQALQSGRLAMYPEYLQVWNTTIAGDRRGFASAYKAYQAGQRYALAHGLELLNPTPFSDTDEIGVTFNYATEHRLTTLHDLRRVATTLTLGGPPQFQQSPNGLPAIEQAYGFVPAAFKVLDVGGQYQALDRGIVQAADVNSTDAELLTGDYRLLGDPRHVRGWGNVVPVASAKVLDAEGPAFARTINRVSALLTLSTMRQLNAAVEVFQQDPATVARQFLMAHGLVVPAAPSGG
jgi:osmoprotectant transport system substrate-binding protein